MSDGGEKIKRENEEEEEEEDGNSIRERRAIISIERAEPDDYGRAASKMAVAQICEGVGFEAIKQSALEAISDIAVRFICDLGKSASFYANLAGRSESNLFDIVKGLQDFSGFSENNIVHQMSDFVRTVEDIEIPFAQPIPRFPVPVMKNSRKWQTPSFLQMGETPSSKHIPDWLQAFPDPHTYIQSPVWSQKKLDPRISKGEQARQRRKAERSLLNLQQRLLSNGLAGPSGSVPPHVNDGDRSMGVPMGDNPFLAPPLPPPPGKNAYENGVRERKHVLVKETFAPAIDALKGNTDDGGLDADAMEIDKRVVPNSIPVKRRPVVNFKLKAGKKMLVEDLDIHLRSKVNEKRTTMLGRDDDKDDKIICGVISILVHFWKNNLLVKSQIQRKKLRNYGINGPSPSFFLGNVPEMQRIQSMVAKSSSHDEIVGHDYTSTLFPYFEQWRNQYGPIYTYSTGNRQHLYVNQPDLVREMSQSMTLHLGKPTYVSKALAPMLGNGILRSNGTLWAQQRKIIGAQFFMDKVKSMMGLMKEAAQEMLGKWEACIEAQGGSIAEVRVDEDLRATSGDMISRACFGSSYSKGKKIFLKLRTLQKLLSKQNFLFKVPTIRFLNTKVQKEVNSLEKEIESLIWEAVQDRVQECSKRCSSDKDLMQWILEGAMNDPDLDKGSSKQLIVDNCKNIYFAGHESTAVAASWCLMLLALHPEWQDNIRADVNQFCKSNEDHDLLVPDVETLLKMKSVTMVIQEALRLYPPAAFISREALEEFQIGDILVPKGVCIWTLIPTLHRDPEIWGPDANDFKPERFANGVSNACKVPQAYLPFGLGARLCVGKNFAMVQLKLLLCNIVSKFSFTLSPKYIHLPTYRMIVEPKHGVHILIKRI